MTESLLRPSEIKLYGRPMEGLAIDPSAISSGLGSNNFLRQQLAHSEARLARIYGFSYEGHYYYLGQPVVFLVHGDGEAADHTTTRSSGVAVRDWEFTSDLTVWEYDKGDFSLRIDIESGPLETILLEMELESDELQLHYSGKKVQLQYSGKKVQAYYSGKKVRLRPGGD